MDQFIKLGEQLGINQSLGIQLVTFLVVFAFLKQLLFEPYYAAFIERQKRTEGTTELAERFVAETRAMEEKYSHRAQEVNDRFREVYEKNRTEAMRDYDRVIGEARNKAKGLVDDSREKIQKEMESVRAQLSQDVASVSQLINQKLIGKDLSA